MRTDWYPVAFNCSRIAHVCIILWLTGSVGAAHGQPVHVEWLNFEEHGVAYLALNAFESEIDIPRQTARESAYASSARPAIHQPSGAALRTDGTQGSRNVYPLIVENPLKNVPDSPEARAFLGVLEDVGDTHGPTGSWKPETLEQWEKLLRVLTTRDEIWLYGRIIRSREVADVLKDVYAVRGYPSAQNPVFPHLARGVLAVLDADGRPLTSIDVAFENGRSDAAVYRTVTFANVGSEPLLVYTYKEPRAPIRLSGAPSLLYPAETTSSHLKLEQSVFAIARQESKALLRYASGGVEHDALEVRARHSGWIHDASAAFAATATLVFGMLSDLGLPHLAIAAAGLLISLLIVAVLRSSANVTAPRFAFRLPVGRMRRYGRLVRADLAGLRRRCKFLLDAVRSAGFRISDRASTGVIALKNRIAPNGGVLNATLSDWMSSIREAAGRRMTWLRQRSSRGAALLRGASVGGMASLRQASVQSAASLREASAQGASSLQEASGRRAKLLQESARRRASAFREASGRITEITSQGISRMFTMLQHEFVRTTHRRSAVLFRGLFERAVRAWDRALVRGRRLRVNVYLYREFATEPIHPRDGSECVDRIRQLTRDLRSVSTTSFSPAARRTLLKEAKRMARRLEVDLAHGRVTQTTTNFQILWALRLLLAILKGPPKKMSGAVHRWLDGADRVLRSGAHDGVGPTVPEFLSLVTPEYVVGGGHSQSI